MNRKLTQNPMWLSKVRHRAFTGRMIGMFWIMGVAWFSGSLIRATSAESNQTTNIPNPNDRVAIALASFPQDKPPCTMKTIYMPEPDGGMLEVKLAYPITQRATNSQGNPYSAVHALPQGMATADDNNEFRVPAGAPIVLQEDKVSPPIHRPNGQLLSVQRHDRPRRLSARDGIPGESLFQVYVTDPAVAVRAGSITQIKGFSTAPLERLTCTIRSTLGRIDDEPGFIIAKHFDSQQWEFTTNWFHWMDVPLALGTNYLELKFTAESGATFTTNLVLSFLPHLDKTPPEMSIRWPPPDAQIATDFISIRGEIDDENTEVFARITADGRSETKAGLVERNRRFWVEQLPLLGKTNLVTVVAVDSVGNRATTNFSVFRSNVEVAVDPLPAAELWHLQTTITGTIRPPDFHVLVNGISAEVQSDGRWVANGIPLDMDGVAIFDVAVLPRNQAVVAREVTSASPSTPGEIRKSLALETTIIVPGVVLNATMPTYGNFKLRASGVEGRNFVLLSSSNLVDWAPILTNLNSAAVFEFADTNTVAHGCRFFKIVPYRVPPNSP
jgi:hypothetical protein